MIHFWKWPVPVNRRENSEARVSRFFFWGNYHLFFNSEHIESGRQVNVSREKSVNINAGKAAFAEQGGTVERGAP